MNYDPVRRTVVGSTLDDVTHPYVGCCGDTESHVIWHAPDCICEHRIVTKPVPDVGGRDIHVPQELTQVKDYGRRNSEGGQPSRQEVALRISERTMWALEAIAYSLKETAEALGLLVEVYRVDAEQ